MRLRYTYSIPLKFGMLPLRRKLEDYVSIASWRKKGEGRGDCSILTCYFNGVYGSVVWGVEVERRHRAEKTAAPLVFGHYVIGVRCDARNAFDTGPIDLDV